MVSFAGGKIDDHAPVFISENFCRLGAGGYVIAGGIIDKERQTVDLRGKSVGKLHVIVKHKSQRNPFGTWLEIIVDCVAGTQADHRRGKCSRAHDGVKKLIP